jgi:hypothetical protein
MNRTFAFTLFVLASLMLVTQVIAEPVTVDLIADGRAEPPDQPIIAGTVTVSNDGTNLSVMYNLTLDPWLLGETHVAVGIMDADGSFAGIPMTGSGNPKVGKFPYSEEHDPINNPITQWTETIELAALEEALGVDLVAGSQIYVAAHAEIVIVGLVDDDNDPDTPDVLGIVEDETGWGDGDSFPGSNWATYINYTIQEEI